MRIEKTYRNSQELLHITSQFILANSKQFRKYLVSDKHHSCPVQIIGYSKEPGIALVRTIDEVIAQYGEDSQIFRCNVP